MVLNIYRRSWFLKDWCSCPYTSFFNDCFAYCGHRWVFVTKFCQEAVGGYKPGFYLYWWYGSFWGFDYMISKLLVRLWVKLWVLLVCEFMPWISVGCVFVAPFIFGKKMMREDRVFSVGWFKSGKNDKLVAKCQFCHLLHKNESP